MKSPLKITVRGLKSVLKSSKEVRAELIKALDDDTERTAFGVVNEARKEAPRLTGQLANSIDVYDEATMSRTVSSDKPYFARQEYEHPTKRGFMRRALTKEDASFRKRIQSTLRRVGGKL